VSDQIEHNASVRVLDDVNPAADRPAVDTLGQRGAVVRRTVAGEDQLQLDSFVDQSLECLDESKDSLARLERAYVENVGSSLRQRSLKRQVRLRVGELPAAEPYEPRLDAQLLPYLLSSELARREERHLSSK
jgi:hypothetical protein